LSLLIRKSWVVFVYATTISIESILIEYLTTYSSIQITPILLSSISITLGGVFLLLVTIFILKKKEGIILLFVKSWKNLSLASFFLSIGIFTWYDSINRIGASKEILIAGPLEIVIIVILARLFLKEKLRRIHIIGIAVALLGFILAVMSDSSTNVVGENVGWNEILFASSSSPLIVTFGDVEAILSAFGFAFGVLFLTKLVSKHSSIEVASTSMLISGLILVGSLIVGTLLSEIQQQIPAYGTSMLAPYIQENQQIVFITIVVLLLFSLLPFIGSLSYSTGLSRIGASLTATIGSSSIIITLVIQIILREVGFPSNLPDNILLAVLGGIMGFSGIYLIHLHDYSLYSGKK
jgi:drug/metabolite transporter (DMT)-like permease